MLHACNIIVFNEVCMKKQHIVKFIVQNHFHIHFTVFILMLVPYCFKFYSKYWHNGIDVLIEGFFIVLITYSFLCISPAHYIMRLILTDAFHIKDTNEYNEIRKEFNDMFYDFRLIEYKLYNKILITTTIPVIILFWIVLSI